MPRNRSTDAETIVRGLGDPSPYLLSDERVVVAVRRHVMVLLAALLETLGFILGALMIQMLLSYMPVIRTVTLLIALAAVARFCYLVLEWRVERFVITDQRMMLVGGVLTRQVAVMPMRKVTDLTFEKPLAGQVLGYGTFIVESAGQDQALSRIEYLPQANRLYLKVSSLLFGGERTAAQRQDHELVVDVPLRREPARSAAGHEHAVPPAASLEHAVPPAAEDLTRTDPQLGDKLAEVDFDDPPAELREVWAARLADSSGDTPGSSPRFDALQQQQPQSSGGRMRERLGGLNGRGRRRSAEPQQPGPIQHRS